MISLFDIFQEAFLHRLLPFFQEVSLSALRGFQPQAYGHVVWAAALGGLVASALCYGIGIALQRVPAKVSNEAQHARIESMRTVSRAWLPWLLILTPLPVGGMLAMASGFFAIRPWVAGGMVVVAEVLWRVSPLM